MPDKILGVIGGSGLYHMKELKILQETTIKTPFGNPSGPLTIGEICGTRLAFLPRHGVGHRIPPSEINFRANIFAMKKIGVERIISVSAVGSMKEEIPPGHIVIPNQFIDRTYRRISTFFTLGMVGHVAFADPICNELSAEVAQASKEDGEDQSGGLQVDIHQTVLEELPAKWSERTSRSLDMTPADASEGLFKNFTVILILKPKVNKRNPILIFA